MDDVDILREAEEYVMQYLTAHLPSWAVYHNSQHTREVVAACIEIGGGMGLGEDDLEVVQLAGWFHDVGYVDGPVDHEERGVGMALAFLRERGYPEERLELVADCIRATKLPHRDGTLLEEVVSDADVAHVGSEDFWAKGNRLRREWEERTGEVFTDEEWFRKNLDFLIQCEFRTAYAQSVFEPRKREHIVDVQSELARLGGNADVSG